MEVSPFWLCLVIIIFFFLFSFSLVITMYVEGKAPIDTGGGARRVVRRPHKINDTIVIFTLAFLFTF